MAIMSTTAPLVSSSAPAGLDSAADVGAALRGWKKIAAYLHRDVRTVQRWERNEHLPVHRQLHLKLGTVHAVRAELDEWLANRTSPGAGTQTSFRTRDPRAYELYLRGRQLFHQFRRRSFERAREMFSRAIALDPEFAIAHTGLGRREAASSAYTRAVKVAKQQLSVSPGDVRALYLGAGCLARIGRRKTALAWAARALDLDGKDSAVLYNVGCLYAILGR